MVLTLLPSAEVLTVAWLKANTDLLAIHGGRVGTKLASTLPAVRVQRVSGAVVELWEDQPVLQVDCWAADQATADTLARSVVAALPTFRGSYGSGRVWGYRVESGPFWSPDDPNMSNNARYILTVRLVTSPPL